MRPFEGILIAGAIALFFVVNAKDGPPGDHWSVTRGNHGQAHLTLDRRDGSSHMRTSFDVPWERLKGLEPAQIHQSGNVKFEYAADAGTLLCEGKSGLVRGASGTFTFRANPAFANELKKLGYTGNIGEKDLFHLTLQGVTLELARALPVEGIPPSIQDLENVSIHGVDAKFIAEVRKLGYNKLSAADFVEARIHGVSPEYLAALKAAGYDVPMREMVDLRIHGVSVDYLQELRAEGLRPDASELIELRNHGVRVDLLKAMADSGYPVKQAGQAVQLAVHGVSADLVRDVRALGYEVTADDLIQFRIHGVDANYLRKLAGSGYQKLTPEKIVKLRIHGID